jgi:hypothetical protein
LYTLVQERENRNDEKKQYKARSKGRREKKCRAEPPSNAEKRPPSRNAQFVRSIGDVGMMNGESGHSPE